MTTALGYEQQDAREVRLLQHVALVRRIARQTAALLPPSVELADLEQAGIIGLWDALERDRGESEEKFAAYAAIRIRGAIFDELRRQDWMPRRGRAKERRIEKAERSLSQQLGRPPDDVEMAAYLGMALEDYQAELAGSSVQLLYLEDLAPDGATDYIDRHVSHEGRGPEALLQTEEMERDLQRAIQDLPEREGLVLALYYQEDLQLKEIGAVLEVSESRVSQLLRQAVMRLRAHLHEHLSL